MNPIKIAKRTETVEILNAELVELFRARERVQYEPTLLKGVVSIPVDEDRLSDLIEVTELLHDYCEENGIELTRQDIRRRLTRAVEELENDSIPVVTAYEKAMNILFYGIEENLMCKIS